MSAALQTKRQLEEDADREIEELKDKYEQRLAAEREVSHEGATLPPLSRCLSVIERLSL
jgi:vacuolar-type H+-ATPase subunit H